MEIPGKGEEQEPPDQQAETGGGNAATWAQGPVWGGSSHGAGVHVSVTQGTPG